MACSKDVARKSLQGKTLQNSITKIISSFFIFICKHDSRDSGLSFWENGKSYIHRYCLFVCCFNRYLIFWLTEV